MVDRAAEDYAKILSSVDPSRELNPISMTIDEMLARLDEFEQTLSSVQAENNSIINTHIGAIGDFNDSFDVLRGRIDNLEECVDRIDANVSEMERKVAIAETELNITDYSLKDKLLKPLLAATTSKATGTAAKATNLDENGEFQRIEIFRSDDLFGPSKVNETATEDPTTSPTGQ